MVGAVMMAAEASEGALEVEAVSVVSVEAADNVSLKEVTYVFVSL